MSPDEHRNLRAALVAQLDACSSAVDYAELQRALANGILVAERQRGNESADSERNIRLLRIIGDAVAWRVLTRHEIRQLAKNQGNPSPLSEQCEAFERVMVSTEMLAQEQGVVSIVTDLTHALRIGDLVVRLPPDGVTLLEFKMSGSRERSPRGRLARQLLRMSVALDAIETDRNPHVEGVAPMRAISAESEEVNRWEVVEAIVTEALENGSARMVIDACDVVTSARSDMLDRLDLSRPEEWGTCLASIHVDRLLKPDPGVRPIPAWPVSREARLALLECDVTLVHLFNPRALEGATDLGNLSLVSDEGVVRVRTFSGTEFQSHGPPGLLQRALYEFQSAESLRAQIIEVVHRGAAHMADEEEHGDPETVWSYLRRKGHVSRRTSPEHG